MIDAHFDAVIRIVNDLQKVKNIDQFEEEIVASIETLFSASDTLILDWTHFFQGERSFHQDDMFFHHHEIQTGWDYPRFQHQDPLYQWIVSGRCHKDFNVTRLSDLVSFQEIRDTEFNKEILEPLNCRYVMTMAAHHNSNMVLSLSLLRPPGVNDFSKTDVRAAQILTPVLASAYSHFVLRSEAGQKDDVFEIISGRHQEEAIAVFSKDFRSIYRSDKMTMLGRRLSKHGDNIREIFNKSPSLESYLDLFISSHQASHRRMPLAIEDTVKIKNGFYLNIKMQCYLYNEDKRYLVVDVSVAKEEITHNSLERDFGLTSREYQIAQLAAKGLSNRDIAEQLAISPWSVKNHLHNIYKKTEVNSRVQLSQLIHQG